MPDNYVIVADAATQTGYSREHIRRLARNGEIKSRKVGIVVLVDITSLKKHQAEQDAVRAAHQGDDESK